MSDYSFRVSEKYFNRLEGVLNSKLFGGNIPFEAKNCDESYAKRCAEFFEKLSIENDAFFELIDGGMDYVLDLIEERGEEFDLGGDMDEEFTPERFVEITVPDVVVFERHELLTNEDSPIAFSMKMHLRAVPDETFELAMQEDKAIYAGEYRGVSPWNEKLLKKKWNYVGRD